MTNVNISTMTVHTNPAKQLLTRLFEETLPNNGMTFRKQQMELSLKMLDALQHNNIALCEAEVGTGKTHAYILASIVHCIFEPTAKSCVISTSTLALQKAIVKEYLPQISKILLSNRIIKKPLRFIVRKGKRHYICENRLRTLINALSKAQQPVRLLEEALYNPIQLEVDDLQVTEYIKRAICVGRCEEHCTFKNQCRYKQFMEKAKQGNYDFQIVNHNYLLANVLVEKEYGQGLLSLFSQVVLDEAHKLPNIIKDMYSEEFSSDEIPNLLLQVARTRRMSVGTYQKILRANDVLFEGFQKEQTELLVFSKMIKLRLLRLGNWLKRPLADLRNSKAGELKESISKTIEKLHLLSDDSNHIVWLKASGRDKMTVCYLSTKLRDTINRDLWQLPIPMILTSGTISVGGDFSHLEDSLGLSSQRTRLLKTNTHSPFDYQEQGLLYLPKQMPHPENDSGVYLQRVVAEVQQLIQATHGHTLVLFTSYKMMDKVYYEMSKQGLPFPLFMMGKGKTMVLDQFRESENGVLFASDAAGEGIDLAGDVLSSVVVVRLPFSYPNAVSEYEKKQKGGIEVYMQTDIIPTMIIKLRQWIGRGIRRETDTCVFSILDSRAKTRYRDQILSALPEMEVTHDIQQVETFIKTKKQPSYFQVGGIA